MRAERQAVAGLFSAKLIVLMVVAGVVLAGTASAVAWHEGSRFHVETCTWGASSMQVELVDGAVEHVLAGPDLTGCAP